MEAAIFRHVQTSTENKEAREFIKTAEGYLHAGKEEGESVNLKTTFIL